MHDNELSQNWKTGTNFSGIKTDVPGGIASLVMGIIGLFLSLCTGCGIIGFILSIIAFVKGKGAVKLYESNPSLYNEQSYNQAKAGKVLGLIGLILGILVIFLLILLLITGALAEMMK